MKHIYFFIISFFSIYTLAQTDSVKIEPKKSKIHFSASIGIDVLGPAIGLFSENKNFSGLVNIQFYRSWFMQFALGNNKNYYEDLDWKIAIRGMYGKIGAQYIITQDKQFKENMFYIGGKIGYSRFKQEVRQAPVRASNQSIQFINFPEENASVVWFEMPVGGRVNILKEKLFIEAILQPKILISHSSDVSGMKPILMPDFGVDRSGLNINVFWGLVYKLK